jgi:hypothetical protein
MTKSDGSQPDKYGDAWLLYCDVFHELYGPKVRVELSPSAMGAFAERLRAPSAGTSIKGDPLFAAYSALRSTLGLIVNNPGKFEPDFELEVRQAVDAAHLALTTATVAPSATVECPECNVRFDPTWDRRPVGPTGVKS